MTYTIGSLFSGIGGLELGLEWAGLGPVQWQCEIDPFCNRILAKHWPNVQRYQDVKALTNPRYVDIICGGFPCQDVSSAGKRAGMGEGTRSGLWSEYKRAVGEVRPRFVIVENVASGAKLWLPTVRQDLHLLGYDSKALAISARDVGAPFTRGRIFVIAKSYQAMGQKWCRRESNGAIKVCSADGAKQLAIPWKVPWPQYRGMDDGVSPKLDRPRIKALGNAVVPQCAEIVGRCLLTL